MTTTADHSLHAPSDTFGSSPRTAAHASSAAPTVALGRLVAVEARKLVDTRAGRWLLIATFALATLTTALLAYGSAEFAPGKPLLASELANTAIGSLTVLLPVLAIMLAASEWTQQGALVTFTLEPRRLRVLAAKVCALVAAALVSCVVAAGLSLAVAGVASGIGHQRVDWRLDAAVLAWSAAATLLATLQGFAFGALLMNTPAAIVVYFVTPMLLQAVSAIGPKVADAVSWLNTSSAMAPITQGAWNDVHWGKVAVSIGVWVVLPLIAGSVRLVRREVK